MLGVVPSLMTFMLRLGLLVGSHRSNVQLALPSAVAFWRDPWPQVHPLKPQMALVHLSGIQALLRQLPGVDHRIWFQQACDRTLWAAAVKNLSIDPKTRNTERADRHLL